MSVSLTACPPVTFNFTSSPPRITRIGIIGMGEVVVNKIWPALCSADVPLTGLVVCSLEPSSRLNGLAHVYHTIEPGSLLPLGCLYEQGFLSGDTLWIIATPSAYHVAYTVQLAGLCPVALEKPVALTRPQARQLQPFTQNGFSIYPMDHKLFNASVLACLEKCQKNPAVLERVKRVEGIFYETAGISTGRQQEDTIADVQWHLLTLLVALFKTLGTRFAITVESAQVATHAPEPDGRYQTPTVWTASRLHGQLVWPGSQLRYDFCQAKAAPANTKGLRLFDAADRLIDEIDLNETGWHAHARLLQALSQPGVDMKHTLADAISVMELIDRSRELACLEPAYAFGTLPAFLSPNGKEAPAQLSHPSRTTPIFHALRLVL